MRAWRARTLDHNRVCRDGVVKKVFIVWVCLCFLVSTVGPLSQWRFKEGSSVESSCPPCVCHCSSSEYLFDPLGLVNGSLKDCGKQDPVMREEMKKGVVTLLVEELRLQKIVANETLERNRKQVTDVRSSSSKYQKEAEKCDVGVQICEEARERAQAEVSEERKLSALWEKRARDYGWND